MSFCIHLNGFAEDEQYPELDRVSTPVFLCGPCSYDTRTGPHETAPDHAIWPKMSREKHRLLQGHRWSWTRGTRPRCFFTVSSQLRTTNSVGPRSYDLRSAPNSGGGGKKTNVGLSLPHTELPFFPNWKISTLRLSVVHFMASSSSFNGSPSVETSETPSALPQRLPVNARLVWVSRKLSRRPLCHDDCPSRCRGQERRIDEPRSLPRACRLALWSAFDRPEA